MVITLRNKPTRGLCGVTDRVISTVYIPIKVKPILHGGDARFGKVETRVTLPLNKKKIWIMIQLYDCKGNPTLRRTSTFTWYCWYKSMSGIYSFLKKHFIALLHDWLILWTSMAIHIEKSPVQLRSLTPVLYSVLTPNYAFLLEIYFIALLNYWVVPFINMAIHMEKNPLSTYEL